MPGGPWQPAMIGTGRPGLYINFVATALAAITVGARGVVAMPVKAPWGPDNTVQDIFNDTDLLAYYTFNDTPPYNAYYAIKNAFDGGANRIKGYRIEGAGAAKATKTFQDTTVAPVDIFRLDGRYNGQLGNTFFPVVQANPGDNTKTDVVLYINGVATATWTSTVNRGVAGHIQDLVNKINADTKNSYVVATFLAEGNSIPATVAAPGVAMAGGSDGAAPIMADYVNMMSAIELEDFNVFWADLLDTDIPGVTSTFKTWIKGMRGYGKRVSWVTGSALGETDIQATTNANSMNQEGIIYVYPGAKQLNLEGNLVTYRGSAFGSQIAGVRSSLPLAAGMTYKHLENVVDLEKRLGDIIIQSLLKNGVMVLTNMGTQFHVEYGINTLYAPPFGTPPSFKKVAVLNTADAIANSIEFSARQNYIGQVINDEDGQKALMGVIRDFLSIMAGQRAIKQGYTVALNPKFASVDDRVFLTIGMAITDTMDFIYVDINI